MIDPMSATTCGLSRTHAPADWAPGPQDPSSLSPAPPPSPQSTRLWQLRCGSGGLKQGTLGDAGHASPQGGGLPSERLEEPPAPRRAPCPSPLGNKGVQGIRLSARDFCFLFVCGGQAEMPLGRGHLCPQQDSLRAGDLNFSLCQHPLPSAALSCASP